MIRFCVVCSLQEAQGRVSSFEQRIDDLRTEVNGPDLHLPCQQKDELRTRRIEELRKEVLRLEVAQLEKPLISLPL